MATDENNHKNEARDDWTGCTFRVERGPSSEGRAWGMADASFFGVHLLRAGAVLHAITDGLGRCSRNFAPPPRAASFVGSDRRFRLDGPRAGVRGPPKTNARRQFTSSVPQRAAGLRKHNGAPPALRERRAPRTTGRAGPDRAARARPKNDLPRGRADRRRGARGALGRSRSSRS